MVAFIVISGLTLGLTHTVKLTVKPAYIKRKNQVVSFDNYLIFSGAEDGAQTRDPQLGRLMLYQLSYFRNFKWAKMDSNHRRRKPADLQSAPFGHSGICPFALDYSSLFFR